MAVKDNLAIALAEEYLEQAHLAHHSALTKNHAVANLKTLGAILDVLDVVVQQMRMEADKPLVEELGETLDRTREAPGS